MPKCRHSQTPHNHLMFQAKIQQTKIAVKTIYFSLHSRNTICRQAQILFTSASQTVKLNLPSLYCFWFVEYCQNIPSKQDILVGCIFGFRHMEFLHDYVNAICAMYENRSAQQCSSFELATLRHKWSHIPTRRNLWFLFPLALVFSLSSCQFF